MTAARRRPVDCSAEHLMGNRTGRHEPERSQLVEYEAWLETLYIMHVPFEEQEDPTPSRKLHVIAEEWFLDNVFRPSDLHTTALYTMDEDRVSKLMGDCFGGTADCGSRLEAMGAATTVVVRVRASARTATVSSARSIRRVYSNVGLLSEVGTTATLRGAASAPHGRRGGPKKKRRGRHRGGRGRHSSAARPAVVRVRGGPAADIYGTGSGSPAGASGDRSPGRRARASRPYATQVE
jgi:hypothetical protein